MPHIPSITSDYRLLFKPEKHSSYVNDHTIFQATDGRWHLFGCAQLPTEPRPDFERYIVHGSSPSLSQPFEEHKPVIEHGTRAWAPGAIVHNDSYYMFYGPSPTKMAHSHSDASHWMDNDCQMVGCPIDAAHRDHMVVKINDYTFAMYAVGVRGKDACVSVHVSNDLQHWRFVQYALLATPAATLRPPWGALESPYVVHYQGYWYLFVTYTDCSKHNYHDTFVFRSTSPYDFGSFGSDPMQTAITKLHGHASEILFDPQTNSDTHSWKITTAGWRGLNTPHEGAVSIADLIWNPA